MLRRGLCAFIAFLIISVVCSGCFFSRNTKASYYPEVYSQTMQRALDDQKYALVSMVETLDSYVDGGMTAEEAIDFLKRGECRFQLAYDQMDALVAPEGLEESHQKYKDSSLMYLESSRMFQSALSTMDADQVSQGYQKLDQANQLIKEAIELAEKR